MELKKSQKADLKNKQGLFLQVGLLVALAIVFASFQWSTNEKSTHVLDGVAIQDVEFDLIPITEREKPKEIIKPPVMAETFIITEEPFIDDNEPFIDTEGFENIAVAIVEMPDEIEVEDDKIHYIPEEMPQFPGGDRELLKFLAANTNYPELAKENGIKGRVFISFVINKKGEVEQVKITRSVDPSLDKEALRVVKMLPNWKPGYQGGKAVNVAFNVPINFQLN